MIPTIALDMLTPLDREHCAYQSRRDPRGVTLSMLAV
jgi:hypothetical protein